MCAELPSRETNVIFLSFSCKFLINFAHYLHNNRAEHDVEMLAV